MHNATLLSTRQLKAIKAQNEPQNTSEPQNVLRIVLMPGLRGCRVAEPKQAGRAAGQEAIESTVHLSAVVCY